MGGQVGGVGAGVSDVEREVEEVGVLRGKWVEKEEVKGGEVGFVIRGVKELGEGKVGDTVRLVGKRGCEALGGLEEVEREVFVGV